MLLVFRVLIEGELVLKRRKIKVKTKSSRAHEPRTLLSGQFWIGLVYCSKRGKTSHIKVLIFPYCTVK